MMIDEQLINRIKALNALGVSCLQIARESGVKSQTVRRFVDGVSTRMQEETHYALLHAVNDLEDGLVKVDGEDMFGGEIRVERKGFDGMQVFSAFCAGIALAGLFFIFFPFKGIETIATTREMHYMNLETGEEADCSAWDGSRCIHWDITKYGYSHDPGPLKDHNVDVCTFGEKLDEYGNPYCPTEPDSSGGTMSGGDGGSGLIYDKENNVWYNGDPQSEDSSDGGFGSNGL